MQRPTGGVKTSGSSNITETPYGDQSNYRDLGGEGAGNQHPAPGDK